MSYLRIVLFVCLSAGLILSAQEQKPKDDNRIYDQVRMRLANDADVKGGNLDVEVKDGNVTLRGKVRTEKGKEKAEKLAKKVKGVKTVENELVIGPNF